MKPDADEFEGPPIYCPNEQCDFTATSSRNLRYDDYVCPKCGQRLMIRTVFAPNFSGCFSFSCLSCVNFDNMTTCTGFGARSEGRCRIFFTGPCSSDTICDAFDPFEEVIEELVELCKKLPGPYVLKAFVQYDKNKEHEHLTEMELQRLRHAMQCDGCEADVESIISCHDKETEE